MQKEPNRALVIHVFFLAIALPAELFTPALGIIQMRACAPRGSPGANRCDQLSTSGCFAHLWHRFPPVASLGASRPGSQIRKLHLSRPRAAPHPARAA